MPILIPDESGAPVPQTFSTLTDAIIKRPRKPRQFSNLVPVASRGVPGKSVVLDQKDGVIDIVDPKGWDAEPDKTEAEEFTSISLPVQHYPDLVTVRAEEVSGRREFGTEVGYEMPVSRLNEKLDVQRDKFELLWEFQQINAALGLVKNRAGATVFNTATQFGITPTSIELDLANADLNPVASARVIKRNLEQRLGSFSVSGWLWLVTGDMFETLVNKEALIRAYERWQEGAFLRGDGRDGFQISNDVTLVEYKNATLPGGQPIFPTSADVEGGLFVPMADGLFQRRFAPAQDMDNVNTEGLPMYLSPEDLKHRRGVDVLAESNFITYVRELRAIGKIKQA